MTITPTAPEAVIRCDLCGSPANTLTEDGSWCVSHASEQHLADGGWGQFELRGRILMSRAEQRARRRRRRREQN